MNSKNSNIGPRDYKLSEIKRLFALSRNECSKPECSNKLIAEDGKTVIAKICHIEAAKKGGARFNSKMNNDQRRSFDNLIILCDEHHQIIDNKANEDEYRKDVLLNWKKEHLSKSGVKHKDLSEDLIHQFILNTQKYYSKLEALDGPYQPVISNNYLERNDELVLLDKLKKDKVLLLTGISFCGKSEMAKRIALNLFNEDYLYKRVLKTRDASSFLESIGSKRVCILEDPFGHTLENENRNELRLVRDLLKNIPDENLLIITSRTEIVHSVFNDINVEKCKIGNHYWYDLTVNDTSFLRNLWMKLSSKMLIKQKNIDNVLNIIDSEKPIQAGQLEHLSKQEQLTLKEFSKEELYQIAQIDIDEICNDFLNNDNNTWKILAILGLGANTVDGLTIQDLDYIFQAKEDSKSLEDKNKDILSNLGGRDKEQFEYPLYDDSYHNINDIENAIEALEERGYIQLVNHKFIFSHPHYREIGKTIIRKISTIKQKKILPHIFNLLTCLNPDSAYNCTTSLSILFKTFNKTYKVKILNFIYNVGDRCFFPKVADQCSLFLMRIYKNPLVEDYKKDIIFRLQSESEEYGIMFIDTIPIRWSQVDFFGEMFGLNDRTYSLALQSLSKENFLPSETVWRGLISMKNYSVDINLKFLEFAFNSNEIFIRNLCAHLYFLNLNDLYSSFLKDKILTDEHPSVIFHALRGFFQGISKNHKFINKEISERFLYFFKNDEIFCIRSSNLMSNFATDYASDSIKWKRIDYNKHKWLWRIWANYFIHFLKVFPVDVSFSHTPRFSGMMNEAKNFVYPDQAIRISKQMLNRLIAISKFRVLDNWEMHLIDFLIESTSKDPSGRRSIFKRFFTVELPTYFVGYNILWALSQWEQLLEGEKDIITNALDSERIDARWLKSIVLNDHTLPKPKVEATIFGSNDFLKNDTKWLIENIPQSLLLDIITVYRGNDRAIQQIGLSGSSKWAREIIYHIAENNIDIDYENCVNEFLVHFINCVPEEDWELYKITWEKIYKNSKDKDKLMDIVIDRVGKSSFCIKETSYLFEVVIRYHLRNNDIDIFSSKIADKYEVLCYSSTDREVFKVLNTDDFLKKHLFPKMPRQIKILNLLFTLIEKKLSPSEKEECVSEIIKESQNEEIRFQWAFNLINNIEKDNLLNHNLLMILKNIPNKIRDKQKTYFESFDQRDLLTDFKYFYN